MFALLTLLDGAMVLGSESGEAITSVRVGLNGTVKTGRWTPIEVQARTAATGPLTAEVRTRDPEGGIVVATWDVGEPRDGRIRFRVIFQAGRLSSTINVRIVDAGGNRLAERTLRPDSEFVALRESETVVLACGKPAGFQDVTGIRLVEYASAADLPHSSRAYDAADVLVLAGEFHVSADQSRAIEDWVRGGGHVIVTGVRSTPGEQLGGLDGWFPVRITGTHGVRNLGMLESFVGQVEKIPVPRGLRAATIEADDAVTTVELLEGPLLVRGVHGFGRYTYLALDLTGPPLANWGQIAEFAARLIAADRGHTQTENSEGNAPLAHTGITDLASHLFACLQDLKAVRQVPAGQRTVLVILFVLLVGPVDYLLVRRLLKRPHLTWVTFPAMVAACVAITILLAEDTKGDRLLVNQVDLVDIDARNETARTTVFATLYSPKARRYAIAVKPPGYLGKGRRSARVRWFGIPEETYGGIYRAGGLELAKPTYALDPDASGFANLPVAAYSTRTFRADWSRRGAKLAESSLEFSGSQLKGSFTHQLPAPLTDWVLAYGRRVYWPRYSNRPSSAIRPHQVWEARSPLVNSRDLAGLLKRTTKATRRDEESGGTELVTRQAPYDVQSRRTADVLRMITFHDGADGTAYTGLTNAVFRDFDLTGALELKTAVLFGRMQAPSAAVRIDGEESPSGEREVFVRILLPVTRTGPEYRELAPRPED